jgi:aspartyl-tRNA(Asn)/glutamyl-tRNA(Gln) amidotransferase subunit A
MTMFPRSHPSRREFVAAGMAAAAWSTLPALGASQDLATLTLKQASDLLRRRDASPVDLTQACLKRIEQYNPSINAFITISREQAHATAREMEAEQKAGKWRGPLHGIPFALKDNIDTAGIRTTAASGVFKDRVPTEDAEVVARLKKAGAILLGKLNLHEFALGGTSAVTYFGPVHNPWSLDHVPGGSSGGSAAAIAADLCIAALGTDTGGSIRNPASYCGVVGFKPTYGRVSNRGVIPLSWTLDHVGPICKTVEDAALMLAGIAGYDDSDPSSVNIPVADYSRAIRMQPSKLRLGVVRTPFFNNLDAEVGRAMDAALDVLRRLTASVRDVQIPATGPVGEIWNPEIYAYHTPFITKSPELYQESSRAQIQRMAEEKSGIYAQARHQVDVVRREIKKVFATVDLLITPTQRSTAPLLVPPQPVANAGRGGAAGGAGGGNTTAPFNIYGLPTISVPCGFTASGLPIGLQIGAAHFDELTVLALAHAYEQATEWHKKRPILST